MSRNKVRPKPRGRAPVSHDRATHRAVSLSDKIADYEDFEENILPALKKDLKSGMTPKQLREKYSSIIQARQITSALTEKDTAKAGAAAKDILDRAEGKATEKKEVTHRFSEMSDKELDAVLKSEEDDLKDMESRFEQ